MTSTSRREFLSAAAATLALGGGVEVAAAEERSAETSAHGAAFDDQVKPVPLPFDPKSLVGLSTKLIQSHWENNYGGAVKALNAIRSRLALTLSDAASPPYIYTALKREQLVRTGSVVLHEYYFGNLGGSGKVSADMRSKIAGSFGSFDTWESEFRKIGQGLSGGSGWVMLGFNRRLKLLENYSMSDHSTGPIDTSPVLVMDMYEHAYQMDYGAAAAKYIDAFFANINWETVASRL